MYINRGEADVLGGFFGGPARAFLQRRLKAEAADVMVGRRRRIESGEPGPGAAVNRGSGPLAPGLVPLR